MTKFKQKNKPALKYFSLGGGGEVTRNMHVYEYGDEILIVDCGIGFPDSETLGVDVVVPDIHYLKNKLKNINGIIISHGHEDHFGALPYLLKDLGNPPVYASLLVQGFIRRKLEYANMLSGVRLSLIKPGEPFNLGSFKIEAFHVSHSVPDAFGFSIDTPQGKILHISDNKVDLTPAMESGKFDLNKVARCGDEGVLALVTDCLGSTTPGFTSSEKDIEGNLYDVFAKAKGQIFMTTISSNVSRIQQAINAAHSLGRKGSFLGRSIEGNSLIASKLKYMNIPKGFLLHPREASKHPPHKIIYLCAGAYGQSGSALDRLSRQDNRSAKILPEAMVVFSADPAPPGVRNNVDTMIDRLTRLNADIHYYEMQENIYASGHGVAGDKQLVLSLAKPKYCIPISGSPRHMHAYTNLAEEMGIPTKNVFEVESGGVIEFQSGRATKGKPIGVRNVFVDGFGVGDVGTTVLSDRQLLANDGILVVVIPLKKNANKLAGEVIVSNRGFVFAKEFGALLKEVGNIATKVVHGFKGDTENRAKLRHQVEEKVHEFVVKETGRKPIILPIVNEI